MIKEVSELYALAEQKQNLEDDMAGVRHEICKKYCPVKIGDEVVIEAATNYGKTFVVDQVEMYERFDIGFEFSGFLRLKNGSLGTKKRGKARLSLEEEDFDLSIY